MSDKVSSHPVFSTLEWKFLEKSFPVEKLKIIIQRALQMQHQSCEICKRNIPLVRCGRSDCKDPFDSDSND